MYIIPFLTRNEKFDAEKAAGYELSAVHAVKVCDTELNWDTPLTDLVTTKCPGSGQTVLAGLTRKCIKPKRHDSIFCHYSKIGWYHFNWMGQFFSCHRKSVAFFPIMIHLNIGTEIITRIIVSQH